MDIFLAHYTEQDRIGCGCGGKASEHEDICVVEMPLSELAAVADDGRMEDMKTLALVQTLRRREMQLFC